MFEYPNLPTMIAEGSRCKGDFVFESTTEILGFLEGSIEQASPDTLKIGRAGWVHGEILSKGPIIIEGRVEGDIRSHIQITLKPTAQVFGELKAPNINVQAGAVFEGDFNMKEHSQKKDTLKQAA